MVDVHKAGRSDEMQFIKDGTELVCKFFVSEQPEYFASGRIDISYYRAGITARTLERAEAEGLQPEAQLRPPLRWHAWQ